MWTLVEQESGEVQPLWPMPVLADRVRELRTLHGWSAERLAEEMRQQGVPWERMVVTKLENGRRQSIGLDELLALAYVLDVAPVHLVVPPNDANDDGPFFLVVPKTGFTLPVVRDWFRGKEPAPGQDPRIFFAQVPPDELDTAKLSSADVAGESARIRYHRQYGHRLRSGEISSTDYWAGARDAERAARAAAERGGGDGER